MTQEVITLENKKYQWKNTPEYGKCLVPIKILIKILTVADLREYPFGTTFKCNGNKDTYLKIDPNSDNFKINMLHSQVPFRKGIWALRLENSCLAYLEDSYPIDSIGKYIIVG